jgi:hypothetical protein
MYMFGFAICRVGQNHINTVHIRYLLQGDHHMYGRIRCIYTVLTNPSHLAKHQVSSCQGNRPIFAYFMHRGAHKQAWSAREPSHEHVGYCINCDLTLKPPQHEKGSTIQQLSRTPLGQGSGLHTIYVPMWLHLPFCRCLPWPCKNPCQPLQNQPITYMVTAVACAVMAVHPTL